MPPRRYVSSVRTAAAAEKRARVIEVAGRLLREQTNIGAFSLDAVARAAGVTRLTVYNQFGSRCGLLEAVFDARAQQGGLHRIPEAMAMADPHAALNRLIEIFCEFWSTDAAIGRLHDAAAYDPEFAIAIAERHERRRKLIRTLANRSAKKAGVRTRNFDDTVDLVFALTSYAMFRMLSNGRSSKAVCKIVMSACNVAFGALN